MLCALVFSLQPHRFFFLRKLPQHGCSLRIGLYKHAGDMATAFAGCRCCFRHGILPEVLTTPELRASMGENTSPGVGVKDTSPESGANSVLRQNKAYPSITPANEGVTENLNRKGLIIYTAKNKDIFP